MASDCAMQCRLAFPCCGFSDLQPGRRDRGIDFPWGMLCLNAVNVAIVLIAGYYALVAPCAPWPLTVAISLLHMVGITLYGRLLRVDAVDIHSKLRTQEPGDVSTGLLRWCGHCACYVTAGPTTKHCHECRKCVQGFDHHCVYLQSCVGAANYRSFLALLLAMTIWTGGLLAIDAALLLAPTDGAFDFDRCDSRDSTPRLVLLVSHAVLALGCLVLVGGLLALHSYLVATRQTTYEMVIGRRKRLREEKATREARGGEPAEAEAEGLRAKVGNRLGQVVAGMHMRASSPERALPLGLARSRADASPAPKAAANSVAGVV